MTFTKEKPMFGRADLYGKFWCPTHVRGSKKVGVVYKDYALEGTNDKQRT